MIKDRLIIKAFYEGKEVKIIELKNLRYFFNGLNVLSNKWAVSPFKKLWSDFEGDLKCDAMNILIGLIYRDMCIKGGWEVNYKRFKNEMLLKNKYPKVFLMESDYLTIPENNYDNAFRLLTSIDFITNGSHYGYVRIDDRYVDYCRKLGNYLFDTEYAQKSIERNTHYFGDHSSLHHRDAFEERKEFDNKTLN